ncbi:MAG: hypothetical protein ABFQ62_02685 [Patescibacteria group bacterium]
MSSQSAAEKFADLNPELKYAEDWLEVVSSSKDIDALKALISGKGWSLDVYQVLQSTFQKLVERGDEVDLISRIVSQSQLSEHCSEVLYYLAKLGAQPYATLGIMASMQEEYDDEEDEDWEKVESLGKLLLNNTDLVFNEGASIMLTVLRNYFGFED